MLMEEKRICKVQSFFLLCCAIIFGLSDYRIYM